MFSRILLFILLFSIIIPAGLVCDEPTTGEVKEELNKILEELGIEEKKESPAEKKDPGDFLKWLENVFKFFADVFRWIGLIFTKLGPLLIILLICAFLFLFFFLLRKIIPGFGRNKQQTKTQPEDPVTVNKEGDPASSTILYRDAQAAAAGGDYNRAVELLHKASVAVLWDKKILSMGYEYTNSEICRLLTGDYSGPFKTIASCSERITFRYDTVDEAEYNKLHEHYLGCFRGEGL